MRTHLRSLALALTTLVGSATALFAQSVPVEKYTLPNGMTVILHQDRTLPVATINIWYSVGSQDEPPGRSGFAHLFEHLMFMGTKRVPGNQFDVLMETGGGANNANTDLHRTDYYSSGPSSLLPTLLFLDADRLEDMGLMMDQSKLDKQRDVVRNELRQNVENQPYGKSDEAMFKLFFEPSHPYFTGVIGTHEDLEAANVTNVKDFFSTFYVPNNGSLVVAGDFDPAVIKPMIDKMFGTLPKGGDLTRKYTVPPITLEGNAQITVRPTGVKRFTSLDRVELPRTQMTFGSPIWYTSGDANMSIAGRVLSDGKSSRLYKRLVVDEKLASDVSAGQQGYPLAGFFQVSVYAKPDADLNRVEAIVDEELAKLASEGPTTEELERIKANIELGALTQLQSVERKAAALNEYQAAFGEPDSFKRDLDRYRNATRESVMEFCKYTFNTNHRVVTRTLPENNDERAPGPRDEKFGEMSPSPFTPPEFQSAKLANGATVLVSSRKDLPLVHVVAVAKPLMNVDSGGKAGLGSLAAQMIGEGTGNLSAAAFEDAITALGGTFDSGANQENATASMTILKRNFEKGLLLFGNAVASPSLSASEWERVKDLHVDELKQAADNIRVSASIAGNRLLCGENNPYGMPTGGLVSTVEKLTLDDVKNAYSVTFRPETTTFLVAGDVTVEEAKAALDKVLGSWKPAPVQVAKGAVDFAIPARKRLRVFVVDQPGATQTMVRFVAPGVKFDHPDRVGLDLLNTILGGSFTSRLNANLREDKGYTYGARSSWAMGPSAGLFSAAAGVKSDTTGESITEFLKELGRMSAGDITDDEAAKARETVRNETVSAYGSLQGVVGARQGWLVAGLPDQTAQDLAKLSAMTAQDLNALAKRSVKLDEMVLVLVGDKATVLEELKQVTPALPEPVFVDAQGVAVK